MIWSVVASVLFFVVCQTCSWKEDPYVKPQRQESSSFYQTSYGDKQLQQNIGPLFFAGCEVAFGSGHMDSAIVSAQRAYEAADAHLEKTK